MSFGDGDLHARVAELEMDNARIREVARQMWRELKAIGPDDVFCFDAFERMARDAGLEDGR